MRRQSILFLAIVALFVFIPWTSKSAFAGQLVIWGNIGDPNDPCAPIEPNLPWHPDNTDYTGVSAFGFRHFLVLRSDGTIIDWLFSPENCGYFNLCEHPDSNDFIKVSSGTEHGMALRSDGSIVAWGNNGFDLLDVPEGEFVDVATGGFTGLAIRADGSLVEWGYIYVPPIDHNIIEPNIVETPPPGNNFVDIAVGSGSLYALDSYGTITAWGQNNYGECDVPEGNDFIKIAAGRNFALALREDGSLAGWGRNHYGQCDVPTGNDFVDIDAGYYHALAIRADRTLIGWGQNSFGQCDVPDGNDFVAIAAGDEHGMALTSDDFKILTMTTDPPNLDCVSPSLGETEYYNGQTIFVNAPCCPDCPNVYKFDHWEGDVADANSSLTSLVMDSDKYIKAVYVADQRVCGDECHPILQGDLNKDCYINFEDFALYSLMWMSCTHPDCD